MSTILLSPIIQAISRLCVFKQKFIGVSKIWGNFDILQIVSCILQLVECSISFVEVQIQFILDILQREKDSKRATFPLLQIVGESI